MFKRVNNWHLSILVIIVSVLSILMVDRYVFAQWQEPSALPGSVSSRNVVVSPMTNALNLNDQTVYGDNITIDPDGTDVIDVTGNICFSGTDCRSSWPADPTDPIWTQDKTGIYYNSGNVSIGSSNLPQKLYVSGGNILLDNNTSIKQYGSKGSEYSVFFLDDSDTLNLFGNNIYFNDLNGNKLMYLNDAGTTGYIGLGIDAPNKHLHIYDETTNAEIDLQSVAGSENHWGIYHDASSDDLRLWKDGDNLFSFSDSGYFGIGTMNPSHQLHVESADQNAIYGEAQTAGKYAVYGENTAVGGSGIYGQGFYGLVSQSTQTSGAGIYSNKGTGDYSGLFVGTLRVVNPSSGLGYLHLAVTATDPPITDCDSTDDRGKIIYNYVDDYLYICDYDPALPGGGGRKFYPQIATP